MSIYTLYIQIGIKVMTISAISSDYSYFQSYQNQYFGGTVSISQFQYLMQQYGVQSTGDSYKDVQNLYQAMYAEAAVDAVSANASSNSDQATKPSPPSEAPNTNNVPWANLMNQVGLSAIGDLATDHAAFNNRILSMQSSGALAQQEQASIDQLIAEASIVFVPPPGPPPSQPQDQGSTKVPEVTGADITAQLNRMFFLDQ